MPEGLYIFSAKMLCTCANYVCKMETITDAANITGM
jgi:hypothetical protein